MKTHHAVVGCLVCVQSLAWAGGQASAGTISFADAVMAMEPVSYWRLGELSGATAFDETGLNPGTYTGGTLGQPGAVINDADTSVYFNGQTDYLAIPHQAGYLLDSGTIMFNFQDQNSIHDAGLFSKDSNNKGTGGHLSLFTTADGRLEARIQDAAESHIALTEPFIQLDRWFHVALTFGDPNVGMTLYINGVPVANNPYTGGLGATSGGTGNLEPIVVGSSGAFSDPAGGLFPLDDYFSGLIDELIIFDHPLTPGEVNDLFTIKVVPEPATAWLILFGAAAVVRRRRWSRTRDS